MFGAGSGSARPRARLGARARVGVPALGPRSGLARGGGGGRRLEQMARPLRVPSGAACGAGVHPRGSAPPPTLAPLLIRRFGGTLCGRSGTGWGRGRLRTRSGARPHRLALPQGFDRSGYAHGVVRDLQRGLGSILGTCGGGGHCAGPQWTPSKELGGEEAGLRVLAGKREPSGPSRGGLGGLFMFIGR